MHEAMHRKTFAVKWQLSIVEDSDKKYLCHLLKAAEIRLNNFFISDMDYSETSAGVF